MQTHDIYVDFDPLEIKMPGAGPFVGKINIILPEVHFKMMDLTMGIPMMQGAHLGGDARLWRFHFTVEEPGMEAGDLLKFIEASESNLKEMHKLIQAEMDKKFLLEGK
jgi:hypothetical protein